MLYSAEIGRNIVLLRKVRKITQEQLALQSDVSVSRLREIEHGVANLSLDFLESLAKTLKVEPPVLMVYSMSDADILSMVHDAQQDQAEAVWYG